MNDNWKTPEKILEPVREVLGPDYFDPCPVDPKFNGIQIDWPCRNTFINPPYSRGSLEGWSRKALKEYRLADQACMHFDVIWLINYGCTDNRREIKRLATAICDLYNRVAFENPRTGQPAKQNDRDSVIYYWGDEPEEFQARFNHLGEVFLK